MSEKHIVVHGAICQCQKGFVPDIMEVTSQQYAYANDKNASEKLVATTLELGTPFKNKTFGLCKLQPTGNSYKPCQPMITGWNGAYENVELRNGAKILLEDSKATCAIAGSGVVTISYHGQIAEPSQQNIDNADEDTQAQLNPMVNMNEITEPELNFDGLKFN